MGSIKVTAMVCDNPQCGKTTISTPDDPALGYYLNKGMYHTGAGGGPIPSLYACSEKCIIPAIQSAINGQWKDSFQRRKN